jgi:soluble lytic murein transglycosylase-like protein
MNRIIQVCSLLMILLALSVLVQAQNKLIIPIQITKSEATLMKLQTVGINSEKMAKAIDLASQQTGLSSEFLIALMHTESTGNIKAVSSKGYRGLMQIPFAVYYADANMLIGAHIFNEKMQQADGDVVKAILLYKGYPLGSERGLQQAKKVLALYHKLKEVV